MLSAAFKGFLEKCCLSISNRFSPVSFVFDLHNPKMFKLYLQFNRVIVNQHYKCNSLIAIAPAVVFI